MTHPVKAMDIKSATHEAVNVSPPPYIQGNMWKYNDGWELASPEYLDMVKAQKQADLTAFAKSYMDTKMQDYSTWESAIWNDLVKQCEQFQIDGTIGKDMQADIGVKYKTAEELATTILYRDSVFRPLRAGIILTRQQKESQIEAAETIEDLNAINIQTGWPE
jgi:hypothetical protein